MSNVLKRTTLIVGDVERSMAFYRDVLDLTVWYDDEIVLGYPCPPGSAPIAPASAARFSVRGAGGADVTDDAEFLGPGRIFLRDHRTHRRSGVVPA
jgi:catechol 2,3-dioxygenase-like lactoylglutathione lyase family enzyme